MIAGRGATIGLALMAAAMWGLWWAPVRWIEAAGLAGAWSGLAMTAGALPVFAAAALLARGRAAGRAPAPMAARALLGGVACGAAVMLYAAALGFTDVVRAVLLFYLAPVWSTAIECLFLGRRWGWRSGLALVLCAAGMMAIFRVGLDGGLGGGVWGIGDSMALGSGLAWSVGTALIFTAPAPGTGRLSVATGLGALAAGALVALAGGAAGDLPGAGTLIAALPVALATGAFYLAPIILITMWSAQRLPPATLSFLLTAEIVSGVVSSALFLDEGFGLPEALGAVLVTLGALAEVLPAPRARRRRDPA
ncbi:MAG: DMT family transporter [Thermohalobaculum sp.]|nr:DMT family transporter [Thermohalobaculum sp.]